MSSSALVLLIDALASGLAEWESLGCHAMLAAVITMDQLTRMAFRGKRSAFAADTDALAMAKRLLASGAVADMAPLCRLFAIMPLQHSECLDDQNRAVELMDALMVDASGTEVGSYLAECAAFARTHQSVVAIFGRFPHRNAILGRDTSEAEFAFLKDDVSSGWGQGSIAGEKVALGSVHQTQRCRL